MPFININAKNETWKLKACITNQYLPVSNSQMMTEVKKTINTLKGERSEASPSKNLFMMSMIFSRRRWGMMRSITHVPILAVVCGNIAASRKTPSAPRNTASADKRHLLNIAHKTRCACEFCQLRQVDKDKSPASPHRQRYARR